ncbi:MAG: SWIM zinc finger family protein [Methylovulum sp.]|nr:SWIM zinc finger family protein [Methylovulum sp.]
MNREQILALAPDAASISAAKPLCNAKTWPTLGFSARAVWGEYKGSGSKPYQTRIDLHGNAFKCSCPSRKFPCKHGLALYLLYAEDIASFSQTDTGPAWVSEWLAGRDGKTEAKKAAVKDKPVDAKAQAKRQQQRDAEMSQGVAELALWLEDLVRIGFAELPAKPLRYWDTLAARMVDAKLPGLTVRIKKLSGLLLQKGDNLSAFAEEIARLHLLVQAFSQRGQLPVESQADLQQLLGIPLREDEVLKTTPVTDTWTVLASRDSEDNALITREVWLLGEANGRFAKLLQFAHASQRQTLTSWLIGNRIHGAVHFYPSANPLRAVLGDCQADPATATVPLPNHFPLWQDYPQLKIRNPWLTLYPVIIAKTMPCYQNDRLYLRNDDGEALAVDTRQMPPWALLALSGGEAVTVFGEWDGQCLQALGVWHPHGYALLARTVSL